MSKAKADFSNAIFDEETIKYFEEQKVKEDALKFIKEESERLHKMTPKQFACWLMEQHDEYVEHIKYTVFNGTEFLDGSEFQERYMHITYMYNLLQFLEMREITHISKKSIEYMLKKGYDNLVTILNTLNYY